MNIDVTTLAVSKNYTDKQIEKVSIKGVDLSGYVQSVNGVKPDKNGNVEVSGGNANLGVTGATVGQTVKISAVDENGVPTAWESVDFPSGGDSNDDLEITTETWEFSEGVSSFVKTFDKPIKYLKLYSGSQTISSGDVNVSIKVDDVLVVSNLTQIYRPNGGSVFLTVDTVGGFLTILYRGRDSVNVFPSSLNLYAFTAGVSAGAKTWGGIVRYTADGRIYSKREYSKIELVLSAAMKASTTWDIEIGR